jgi:hypothetical protein
MPAKGSSAAALHGPICLQLLIVENGLEALQKLLAFATSKGRVGDDTGRTHKLGDGVPSRCAQD